MPEALLDRLPEVAREIGAASHLLLCLDFDGTLAPIVPDPADARMPGETRAALGQLISLPGATVAIVSGRAGEAAENQDALLVKPARDELLRHEIHTVVKRADHTEIGQAMQPHQFRL